MQAPPEPMQLPLDECTQTTWWKQSICISSTLTGQTGHHHRSDLCATCEQGQHSDRSDRWHTEPEMAGNHMKTFQMHSVAQNMLKLFLLVDNAWINPKMQKMQPRASQIDKNQHRMLHMSKWASEILYSFVITSTTRSPSFTTLDEAKMELSNFAKIFPLMSKVLNMSKTCQNGKATQTSC
jgi:hypothetical protein